jgi:uncharacterized protein
MKIVVDINHPAHVHYFKNFIREMQKRGHEILITASDKEISYTLLDNYGFSYVKIGNYGKSLLQKMINIPLLDLKMYLTVRKFQPDLFLGFGSIRSAHVSKLMRKPCIALDDTEHAKWEHLLYVPFTDIIVTPSCFKKDFGKKHIRYNGYTELSYLHPHYFTPDPGVLKEIGIGMDEPYCILRFISWNASHDIGHTGIENKLDFIRIIEKYARVFISSEGPLPEPLKKYELKTAPEKMHDLLYFASFYIGEGGTMATEAAVLGTPSILISSLAKYCGVHNELRENYQLQYFFDNENEAVDFISILINHKLIKKEWQTKRDVMLSEKIDVTGFMVDLVEHGGKCP